MAGGPCRLAAAAAAGGHIRPGRLECSLLRDFHIQRIHNDIGGICRSDTRQAASGQPLPRHPGRTRSCLKPPDGRLLMLCLFSGCTTQQLSILFQGAAMAPATRPAALLALLALACLAAPAAAAAAQGCKKLGQACTSDQSCCPGRNQTMLDDYRSSVLHRPLATLHRSACLSCAACSGWRRQRHLPPASRPRSQHLPDCDCRRWHDHDRPTCGGKPTAAAAATCHASAVRSQPSPARSRHATAALPGARPGAAGWDVLLRCAVLPRG